MNEILVSCIMPTADRELYVPLAINYFLEQDYPNAELIIVDDGKHSIAHLVPSHPKISYYYTPHFNSIGLKRNYACTKATGEIIMHWDDDDWHAKDWISAQVYFLTNSGSDLCGIQHIIYYSAITDKRLKVIRMGVDSTQSAMDWLHGATLAYWKSFWQLHPFKDLKTAEDDDFIQNNGAKLFIHEYTNGFVCILHPHNTVFREFEERKHKKIKKDD